MTRTEPRWLPNADAAGRVYSRLCRLETKTTDQSVADTSVRLRTVLREASALTIRLHDGIVVRPGFVVSREPNDTGSDRKLPARADRPPATRILGRKGIALRLMLTALFEAQTRTDPGEQPGTNDRPLSHATRGQIAWTDLLATSAEDALAGKTAMTQEDKQRRHLNSALGVLHRAGLVALPHGGEPRNNQREFTLMHESSVPESAAPYIVPASPQEGFVIPTTLFTNDWISVLSDAELAVLLMAMAIYQPNAEGFAIAAGTRTRVFGIGPETYESHRLLEAYGLLRVVRQTGRAPNGRIANFRAGEHVALPDSIQFLPIGLERDGYGTVCDALSSMFCR
ncbi:hypothetical protein Daura_05995 [Dactylosporangium aurantiacum]|uniref:Uncharacterized protein n=1 Tax=Dactylosporangium aurantiacum TaxID=35754 RepID=A0A9Q9MNI7_9ACTN|nr:hypothetical protein [Dactylosporangium aurantiacum]MDG6108842.1 hypothetical protein [Dactylosporangium aurantiacum]UWZ55752.1 hypothetical protein Daura_05995 [Dactylosporangium aurantiacum]